MGFEAPLSLDNPVMKDFVFYTAVVLIKMMVLALITSLTRLKTGVFANQEDIKLTPGGKIQFNNDSVERIRRNHLNDIENIIPFILVGLFYVLTDPAHSTAVVVFRIFAVSRIMHTIAYQFALPVPSRGLCFGVGYFTTVFMAVKCLLHCL